MAAPREAKRGLDTRSAGLEERRAVLMRARPLISLLVMLGWSGVPGRAAELVRLDSTTTELSLTPFLQFYRDATGRMTLEEVRRQWEQGQFKVGSDPRPSLGFTEDAIWMRLRLAHHGPVPALWIVELETPRLDCVDGFLMRSGGETQHFQAGNRRVPSPEMMEGSRPGFPVPLQPGEEVEFLIRVHSETALMLALSVRSARRYAIAQAELANSAAGYFGYLKALIVLSLIIGIITRERDSVTYALAMTAVTCFYLLVSGQLTWRDLPGQDFVLKQGMILAGATALLLMMVFLRSLLDLRLNLPRMDRWTVRVIWVHAAVTLVLLVLPFRLAYPIFLAHALAVGLCLMLSTLFAWRHGIRAARFYALAWVVFWVSYGLSSVPFLSGQNLAAPVWQYSLLGIVMSGTLFLIAIADRVRVLRRIAQQAQLGLLAAERRISEQLRLQLRQKQSLIRDLHDGIGGLTANLAILAELGRRNAVADSDREQFARVSDLASDGGMEVRSLMRSLEAGEMSWDDVTDEIRRHGRTALEPHGIEFSLTVTGQADQPGPGVYAGLSLIRLLKEAFSNTVKHAACTRMAVDATFTPDCLRLSVRDNGRGLPSQRPTTGRGLRNMATRIEEIGGSMSYHSAGGLELIFELPLPINFADPSNAAAETSQPGARPSTPVDPSPGPARRRTFLARIRFGLFS